MFFDTLHLLRVFIYKLLPTFNLNHQLKPHGSTRAIEHDDGELITGTVYS